MAGISTISGSWVRPVSELSDGRLLESHCQIDGAQPDLLDVVRLEYSEAVGNPAQPENLLIAEAPWSLAEKISPDEAYERLAPHLAEGGQLLGNRGAAVPEDVAAEGLEASLALVEPEADFRFVRAEPAPGQARQRARVGFRFGGKDYVLTLTDFPIRAQMAGLQCGEYAPSDLGFPDDHRPLITVSLGEPRNGWHTKLAAAVLFVPEAGCDSLRPASSAPGRC